MKNLAAWWCGAAWALAARGAAGAGAALAGYVPANDVLQHSRIDLDLSDLDALLLAARWDDAGALYAGGRYSDKGQGKLRNLRAFSTDLEAKAKPLSPPLADFELFRSYYGRGDYADAFVQQELAQAGNSSLTGNVTLDTVARRELVIKAVQLQGVAMYVLYELAAAISKCSAKAAGASLNWDEGAAFYVGSLSAAPGASPTTGFSFYAFSNKRCIAFGTCGPDKVSVANRRAITAFSRGLALVAQGRCADAALQMAVVRKQLQVALLQGVLLYTQKASLGGTLKDRAEAWAMTRGLLPWLNSSSPRDAVTVSSIVSSALSGVVRGGQGN